MLLYLLNLVSFEEVRSVGEEGRRQERRGGEGRKWQVKKMADLDYRSMSLTLHVAYPSLLEMALKVMSALYR